MANPHTKGLGDQIAPNVFWLKLILGTDCKTNPWKTVDYCFDLRAHKVRGPSELQGGLAKDLTDLAHANSGLQRF